MKEVREQLGNANRQRLKWQEETRGHESHVSTLKADLAMGDKKLQVQNAYNELQREAKIFKE